MNMDSDDPRMRSIMDPNALQSVHLNFGHLLDLISELNFGSDIQDEPTRMALAQAFLAGAYHSEHLKAQQKRPAFAKPIGAFRSGLTPQRTT